MPTAGDPTHLVGQPAKPFADGVDLQIAAAVGQLPPLTFVRSRRVAITGAEPGHVVAQRVLIALGRIEWADAQTARVANNRWASGLNGQWLTYTLKYAHSAWRVAGVAGNRIAIS